MNGTMNGTMMPYEPEDDKKKKKKWSLTEWEDKRMRHTSGRIFVHVLYCIATMMLIIMFIMLIADIWKTYENKKTEK